MLIHVDISARNDAQQIAQHKHHEPAAAIKQHASI
jgi:hypothetical protein